MLISVYLLLGFLAPCFCVLLILSFMFTAYIIRADAAEWSVTTITYNALAISMRMRADSNFYECRNYGVSYNYDAQL